MNRNESDLFRLLHRGVVETIVEDDLVKKLQTTKRPLRIKYGVDPTRPDIHLGHTVCFRKLRDFQRLGHEVILIIGDWTAQIGDPSMRSATRTMLTAEEVRANAQTYMDQFFRVVDIERTQVAWQSAWFGSFGLADVINLTRKYTVAQMLAREDFAQRFEQGSPISITELLYPLLQAYDSVAIKSDVELGGTDQKFNLLVGREMQQQFGQEPQNIMTVPILAGTDGKQKMSKSLDNYIGVAEAPEQMYGKAMSVPDDVMMEYFELVTDVPEDEITAMRRDLASGVAHPRDLKMRLARAIVEEFHGPEAAAQAQAEFTRVFQQREVPSEVAAFALPGPAPITDVMTRAGLVGSRGEARRLIAQGGVRLDGRRIERDDFVVDPSLNGGAVLQVGRRRFLKIVPAD